MKRNAFSNLLIEIFAIEITSKHWNYRQILTLMQKWKLDEGNVVPEEQRKKTRDCKMFTIVINYNKVSCIQCSRVSKHLLVIFLFSEKNTYCS